MTVMSAEDTTSGAPDRIWAWEWNRYPVKVGDGQGQVEYVRADLTALADPAALERLTRDCQHKLDLQWEAAKAVEAERDRLTASLSAALAASQAMVTAGTFADGVRAAAEVVKDQSKSLYEKVRRNELRYPDLALHKAGAFDEIVDKILALAPPPAAAKGDASC